MIGRAQNGELRLSNSLWCPPSSTFSRLLGSLRYFLQHNVKIPCFGWIDVCSAGGSLHFAVAFRAVFDLSELTKIPEDGQDTILQYYYAISEF
jgi:hypothetical protein